MHGSLHKDMPGSTMLIVRFLSDAQFWLGQLWQRTLVMNTSVGKRLATVSEHVSPWMRAVGWNLCSRKSLHIDCLETLLHLNAYLKVRVCFNRQTEFLNVIEQSLYYSEELPVITIDLNASEKCQFNMKRLPVVLPDFGVSK